MQEQAQGAACPGGMAPRFDDLVAGFFRAATGDMSWSQALDGVQAVFGARIAVLQSVDLRSGRILSLHNGGPPMHNGVLDYLREYHRLDPRRQHLLARGAGGLGQWWHCHEHFDEAFVERDVYYRQFSPAYDLRYLSNVMLMPNEHMVTGFALELPASRGVLDADERELARRLGVQMNEALRAHERVRAMAAQALAGHGLLRNLPYPMWLIDDERYIHFANAPAARETDAATRLARTGHRLQLTDARADTGLSERLRRLFDQPQGASLAMSLRPVADDWPTWLHLSLLIPGQVLGAFGERPLVLATLFDPRQTRRLDAYGLGQLLGLTPAQARVAIALGEGHTPQQIAQAAGLSLSTVRAHIRQVLARLGARRVADVVNLLHSGEALWALPEPDRLDPAA